MPVLASSLPTRSTAPPREPSAPEIGGIRCRRPRGPKVRRAWIVDRPGPMVLGAHVALPRGERSPVWPENVAVSAGLEIEE